MDGVLHFLEERHSFAEPVLNEKGENVFTCEICGYSYTDAWQKDKEGHYKTGKEDEKQAHTYGEWIIDEEAGYLEDGLKHHVCTVCEYEESEVIQALGYGQLDHDEEIALTADASSTIKSEAKVSDGILAVATSDKTMTQETGYLNIGGAINPDSRYLMINAASPMSLFVKFASAKNAEATLALFNEPANENRDNYMADQAKTASTSYLTSEFIIPSAGTYYFGSLGGGIKVKSIQVEIHAINKDVWVKDETSHWHASDDTSCTVQYDLAEHTFDEGVVSEDSTTYTCTVCGKTKVENHHWAESYSSDENKHWLECTDDGCTTKKAEAEHTFEIDTTKEVVHASEDTDGNITYHCSVCEYEKVVITPKITLGTLGEELVTPVDFGEITWQEKVADGLLVAGTDGKSVTYESTASLSWASSVTEEQKFETTGAYFLGGKASGRYIKINISGACTIQLYGTRGSKNNIYVGIGTTLAGIEAATTEELADTTHFNQFTSSNIQLKTYTLTEGGSYYLGTNTGSFKFIGLKVTYTA